MLNLQNVATILGWTLPETETAWTELCEGFMAPHVVWFPVDPELVNDITTDHGRKTEGFYSRLSASGYLDCTDWSGPFKTEDESVADLLSQYAD